MKKIYILYIRKYSIFANDYISRIYYVVTDNIYRVIGKYYCNSFEKIDRISFQRVDNYEFIKSNNIKEYKEPKLSEG